MLFDEIVRLTQAKRQGDGWVGRCPSHDDKRFSFSFREKPGAPDDWPLMKCFVGCTFPQIRAALEAKGLTGQRREREAPGRRTERSWVICDAEGRAVAVHVRIDIENEGKRYRWTSPDGSAKELLDARTGEKLSSLDVPLYGSELLATSDDAPWICEGEKSADALRTLGFIALGTVTGASAVASESVLSVFAGRSIVHLWPDNDDSGRSHMAKIGMKLAALGVRSDVATWREAPFKGDAADFVKPGVTREQVMALLPRATSGVRRLREGLREAEAEMDRYSVGDFSDRIQTGIPRLDRRLRGGLRGGEMTLIGAPSGGGKTTLVQQIATEASKRGPVLLVSPEMTLASLNEREIVRRSGRPLFDRSMWVQSVLRDATIAAHARAAAALDAEDPDLLVLDAPEVTMTDVEEVTRATKGLVLLVIDYAQQVAGDSDAKTPRYLQVGDVGTRGVALALELNIPVIIASQVNVIKEKDRKGYAFRETAILEHKAHTVLVLDVDWNTDGEERRVDAARIVCLKHRSTTPFRLVVDYKPGLYQISDEEEEASAGDFTRPRPPQPQQQRMLTAPPTPE